MNHSYFFCNTSKVERFFNSGIATTYYAHILITIKETIASGATRNTTTHKGFFTWQANVLGRSTSRNNEGITGIRSRITNQANGLLCQCCCMNVVKNDLGIKALGVLQKAVHQLWALNPIRVCWPIFDIGRGH